MIIKRYLVRDMNEAMIKIRYDLGSDAIIVSNRRIRQKGLKNLFKKKVLEVTAVVDRKTEEPAQTKEDPKEEITKKEIKEILETNKAVNQYEDADILKDEIEELRTMINKLMVEKDKQGEKPAKKIEESLIEKVKEKPSKPYKIETPPKTWTENHLISNLDKMMLDEEIIEGFTKFCRENNIYTNLNDEILLEYFESILEKKTFIKDLSKEKIWAFVGPTGVGKTTTIAKIAAIESVTKGKTVGLITLDTYRIGSVEQLQTYADILDIPLEVVVSKEDLEKAIKRLEDRDLILVDTTGRSSLNNQQILEIKELLDTINKKKNILVVSATTRLNDLKDIIKNYKAINFDYVILSKLDETNSYGNIINAIFYGNKPVLYLTTGQDVPDDIRKASKEKIIEYISNEVTV